MYSHIRHLYRKYAPDDDINKGTFTTLDKDKNFIEFIKRLQLLPPGLTFLGPRPEERSDDPDQIKGKIEEQTKKQDLYKSFDLCTIYYSLRIINDDCECEASEAKAKQ